MANLFDRDDIALGIALPFGPGRSNFKCNSLSLLLSILAGASIIRSNACWFIGKAITSLILGSSASNIIILSIPGAEPPWGGAPNFNAFKIPENFFSTEKC